MLFRFTALLALAAALPAVLAGTNTSPTRWRTDATYINNATTPAADPYVRWDQKTGLYWAYSTDGADDGYYYGIYTSPDLATWSKVPGGALKADGENIWADDWFWAPECYYNVRSFFVSPAPCLTLIFNVPYRKRPDGTSSSMLVATGIPRKSLSTSSKRKYPPTIHDLLSQVFWQVPRLR